MTVASARKTILQWGTDDHIRAVMYDTASQQFSVVLFDLAISQVESANVYGAQLTLETGGKKYRYSENHSVVH